MGRKTSPSLALITIAVFLVSAAAAAARDPELEICRQQCKIQTAFDKGQRESCYTKCELYSREKARREQEEEEEEGRRSSEEREDDSPFVFRPRHFLTAHSSERGRLSVLQRFSERSSDIFQVIEPFRLGVLEVEPKTFAIPNHLDADLLCVVASGKGIVNMIEENKRVNFNITEGEMVVIPAGATTYLINPEDDRKLVVVKLIRTISAQPGRFEYFFGSMVMNAFSSSIREAAYSDADRETLEKVLNRSGRKQDPFLAISNEQIESIIRRQEDEDGIGWPFVADKSSKRRRIVDILEHKSISNKFGELYEVGNEEFDDVQISFANITKGGMLGPLFNTRGTKLMFVVEGEGWMEMATADESRRSPRRGSSSERGPSFEGVRARLFPGTVVITPAGHPYANVASRARNLKLLCFHVNARNNEKVALAGKDNVFTRLDRVAEEIAFGGSRKEVEQVFGSNSDYQLFFKGPSREPEEDGGHAAV
ncbi:unnamed protein product [Cuscuta campestris]|uniref:Cupin type-1 domain-containing protein n=1 Tax=Cuscuta campestris TaxID=132261 RepID=A0A484KYD8_9ASTE|nr:unnamed protein product [Cuscuta campestris]